jgi:hypothetical protein
MTSTSPELAPSRGLFARAVGVVVAPAATFADVVRAPRPVGILFLVCLVIAAAGAIPQLTERGQRAAIDMQVAQTERMTGQPVSAEQRGRLEQVARYGSIVSIAGTFVGLPVFCLLLTAVFWALFNVVLGGTAEFKQVLGVVAHSQVIAALGLAAAVPILLMQDTWALTGPFNLGALVPMLEPDSTVVRFLASMSFFGLWQAVVLGIGLAVLYRRKATGPVLTVLTLYLAVSAGLTALGSLFTAGG